ncbi:MAG TPA: FAD-dependent oxidoreductase, partial [bacterium]|nr:FAD-dependent oxidoreductase [bacterium]
MAQVATAYRSVLKRREPVAWGTMAFAFQKPEGFVHRAGQSMEIELPPRATLDDRDRRHHFTIASAPYEDDLMIATRMRPSPFKEALAALPAAAQVTLEDPRGRFLLHEDPARPAVFLAGGIGVTAPRAIIHQTLFEGLGPDLFFFYSDQRPEEAAFLEELRRTARGSSRFTLIPTMTDLDGAEEWDGEVGRIGMRMIRDYVDHVEDPVYYVSGPPKMVRAMKRMLKRAGIPEGG